MAVHRETSHLVPVPGDHPQRWVEFRVFKTVAPPLFESRFLAAGVIAKRFILCLPYCRVVHTLYKRTQLEPFGQPWDLRHILQDDLHPPVITVWLIALILMQGNAIGLIPVYSGFYKDTHVRLGKLHDLTGASLDGTQQRCTDAASLKIGMNTAVHFQDRVFVGVDHLRIARD